jgi:hypothetical protein
MHTRTITKGPSPNASYFIFSLSLPSGKAAGADKKLFKQLENKYDPTSNSNILSPPEDDSIRNIISPFGPMDQPASRKTLFYLIGTLNASFPDYDFS